MILNIATSNLIVVLSDAVSYGVLNVNKSVSWPTMGAELMISLVSVNSMVPVIALENISSYNLLGLVFPVHRFFSVH